MLTKSAAYLLLIVASCGVAAKSAIDMRSESAETTGATFVDKRLPVTQDDAYPDPGATAATDTQADADQSSVADETQAPAGLSDAHVLREDDFELTSESVAADRPADKPVSDSAGGLETADVEHPEPVASTLKGHRQQTPLHSQVVTPGNFEYLGGFCPPPADARGSEFSYGGWALAYHAGGDPDGADDGLPGSLFILGHAQKQLVAEISIPRPVVSPEHRLNELSVATVLQPFGDITGGLRSTMTNGESTEFQIGGLQVVENRLHWTMYKYYNVSEQDYNSHGASSLITNRPFPEGPWHLGPRGSSNRTWNSYKNAGYIFEVPDGLPRAWVGGKRLISGLQISTGLNIASNGPAMYAYNLPPGRTPIGAALRATPLVYNDLARPAAGFHPADRWSGGAWLTIGDKHAVIMVGRKALGPVHYGQPRPQDCTDDKGYHGTPYEAQMLFYSAHSVASAAHGQVNPKSVTPWYVWNHTTPGGGFSRYLFDMCAQHTGGVTYDRERQLLYIAQVTSGTTREEPYDAMPIIHVFRVVE